MGQHSTVNMEHGDEDGKHVYVWTYTDMYITCINIYVIYMYIYIHCTYLCLYVEKWKECRYPTHSGFMFKQIV